MKALILLLSFLFILYSGCGGEGEEASTSGDTATSGEEATAGGDNPTGEGQPNPAGQTGDPAPAASPEPAAGPCTPYAQPCKNDAECGEKYLNCLRPKAGDPARTETVTCTKTGETTYTLVVNEWDAKPSNTDLLCDFIENEETLYLFATLVKGACKTERDSRKEELTKAGYACN